MQKTQVHSLGWKDPLEKGMVTHFSILTWRIPRTEEVGGSQSTKLQSWTWLSNTHTGTGSLAGYSPWSCKESDMTKQHIHIHRYLSTSWVATLYLVTAYQISFSKKTIPIFHNASTETSSLFRALFSIEIRRLLGEVADCASPITYTVVWLNLSVETW